MRRFTDLFAVGAIVLLGGCAGAELTPKEPEILSDASPMLRYTTDQFQLDLNEYEAVDQTPAKRQEIRDRMTRRVMAIITDNFSHFEAEFFTGRAFGETGFDIAGLGLDAAITIVGGERTKTVLGAIATAVGGVRLSIDKNFFREKTSETLLAKMRGQRATKETEIEKKLQLGDGEYSIYEAWGDLVELFYAGTIHSALIGLAEDAGEKAKEAVREKTAVVEARPGMLIAADSRATVRKKAGLSRWFRTLTPEQRRTAINALKSARANNDTPAADLLEIWAELMDETNTKDAVEAARARLTSAGLAVP